MELSLQKFNMDDLISLKEIMALNVQYAGERVKDYEKFIKWNMENENDPYWKIVCDNKMIGYIGFAKAISKPTTSKVSNPNDLFLEIYLHPDYTRKGIGKLAWEKAMDILPKINRKIFASTYISNINAQSFFAKSLKMKVSHYEKKFNAIVFVTCI